MIRRNVGRIAITSVLLAALGVIAVQQRGGSVAAQELSPAAVKSGVLQFDSVGPTRVFDSRTGLGTGPAGPIAPAGPYQGYLIFTPGVPQGATAAMVNLTIVAEQPGSYGYAAATGPGTHLTSNVNWTGPGVYANAALVPIDYIPDPFFHFWLVGNKPVHVIVDLQGWVVPAAP